MCVIAQDYPTFLRFLDVPPPDQCESPLDLNVGPEAFVEIQNNLPGVEDYNELIVLYHQKNWDEFDKKLGKIKTVYENTPLKEPIAFLKIQTRFERVKGALDSTEIKDLDRQFRELMRLYPKSSLVPVLSATYAHFWLKQNQPEKSLSMYESAIDQFPKSEYGCLYRLGVAECKFRMGKVTDSETIFQKVLTSCENPRIFSGAQLRIADAKKSHGMDAESDYRKSYEGKEAIIRRYYPTLFIKLGEVLYQKKNYPSSRFFFSEYEKRRGTIANCKAFSEKRLADINFQANEPVPKLKGEYLKASTDNVNTDYGHYSKVFAFLLDFAGTQRPERVRRIRVIDEELDQIQSDPVRNLGYLQKGLALLDGGEKAALDYLERLSEKAHYDISKGQLADFMRAKLLKILDTEAQQQSDLLNDDGDPKKVYEKLFKPIEVAYDMWLKGTQYERKSRMLFNKLILRKFNNDLEEYEPGDAFDVLKYWQASKVWDEQNLEGATKTEITKQSLMFLRDSSESEADAIVFLNHHKDFQRFVTVPEDFWNLIMLVESKNDLGLKALNVKKQWPKASWPKALDADLGDYFWFTYGQANLLEKKFVESEKAFQQIKSPKWVLKAKDQLLAIYRETKNYKKAYRLTNSLLKSVDSSQRKELLELLRTLAWEAQMWNEADKLLPLAQKAGLSGKSLSPFYFLSGRNYFEKKDCKKSIPNYEKGIELDASSDFAPEGRFRLGKCLMKVNRIAEAKGIWETLVNSKDNFWSPLAKNELKLLQ